MSENKCPLCGGKLVYDSFYDERGASASYSCIACEFVCNPDDLPRIAAAMDLVEVECLREQLMELRFRPWADKDVLERVRKSGGVWEICDMLDCVEKELVLIRKRAIGVFK